MLKTYLYLPEELDRELLLLSRLEGKSKAQIIREVMGEGVRQKKKVATTNGNPSVEVLFKLAELGEEIKAKGPKDLSANHNKYFNE